ncbi:NAD(P)-binding domain-containing protein [candidate division KSB1 bacterium]|nr:NAD(P)-binding domain-containing protein [candidate division KSB1 bacterium]
MNGTQSFGFIGGGRIVRILLEAMQRENQFPAKIIVSDPDNETVARLISAYPDAGISKGINTDAASQDLVFLAVHPPVLKEVLPQIAGTVEGAQALISLAPVFTFAKLSGMLNGYNKIVRMIPNAATYINRGYNPVSFASSIDKSTKQQLLLLLKIFGECPEVKEDKLEAYAIVTAMGSTYLWPQLAELHNLGLEFGMSEEETKKGIKAMVSGTIETLYDAGLNYEQVVDLIPVKPLGEHEAQIRDIYKTKLTGLFKKLKS